MKFQSILFTIASVTAASASSTGPARLGRRTAVLERRGDLCGPLDTPMCCQTDVVGLADLNCAGISSDVTTTEDFESTCSDQGKSAECCTLSLLGDDALLCSAA